MTLTAIDLLELQYKVSQLNGDIHIRKDEEGYIVHFHYYKPEYGTNHESVYINHQNESEWKGESTGFDAMLSILTEEVEEKEKRDEKENKRIELIKSLTPEQSELLGLNL